MVAVGAVDEAFVELWVVFLLVAVILERPILIPPEAVSFTSPESGMVSFSVLSTGLKSITDQYNNYYFSLVLFKVKLIYL